MDSLPEAQTTDVLGRPEAGLIVGNGRQAEPDEVEAVSGAFAVYLQQYTALSLNLFGRWPAFVPPEKQSLALLQTASSLASGAPPLPAALQETPRARWGSPLPGGVSAASSHRGSKLVPSFAGSRRGSHATSFSGTSSLRGAFGGTSSSRGADEESLADEIVAEAEAREEVLRDQIGRMSEKLRTESSRKNSAHDESLHKAVALDAARHQILSLEERSGLLTDQLAQEKARTRTLERTLRAAQTSERAASASAASERKQRFRLEVRIDRLDKSVDPLRLENERRGGVMQQADAARRSAEARMASAEHRAAEMEAQNVSLQKRLDSAQQRFLASKDSVAGSLAELAEAADTVEDAEEARLEAEETARGLSRDLAETRARLADSRENESRASSAAEAAAGLAKAAELALEIAREEAVQLGANLAAAREAEALASNLLEEANRQQAHTREQQSGLFGVLSELLARVLYLKAVPPEVLCMGNNEMMRHEADAVRHLKSIRDAAVRDHLNTDVVCAPPTVAAGAAVLKAAAAATPGAPDLSDWEPPAGTFISRVEPVAALSPRARRRANAAAADAAAVHAVSSPRLALPRSPRHSLPEVPAAPPATTAPAEVKQSPRRDAQSLPSLRPRPFLCKKRNRSHTQTHNKTTTIHDTTRAPLISALLIG